MRESQIWGITLSDVQTTEIQGELQVEVKPRHKKGATYRLQQDKSLPHNIQVWLE